MTQAEVVASVIIHCSDPQEILAKLPEDLRQMAKVYSYDPKHSTKRYQKDESYRTREKARCKQRNKERYANDPEYRAKCLERNREYARKRKSTKSADASI